MTPLGNHDTLNGLPSVTGNRLSGSIPCSTYVQGLSRAFTATKASRKHEGYLGDSDCLNVLCRLLRRCLRERNTNTSTFIPSSVNILEGTGGGLPKHLCSYTSHWHCLFTLLPSPQLNALLIWVASLTFSLKLFF